MQNNALTLNETQSCLNTNRATDEVISNLLQQFDALFPTEKDCLEELYRIAEEEGLLKCRYCSSQNLEKQYGRRIAWCRICKKKTWITGGTFFHGMRMARPWLIAIWFIEHGVILSSLRFHKLVGIAQSSSLHIFKKLTAVIEVHATVEESKQLPSKLFSNAFCRRSRETPAGKHPLAEQEALENQHGQEEEAAAAAAAENDDNGDDDSKGKDKDKGKGKGKGKDLCKSKKKIEEIASVNGVENFDRNEKAIYDCLSSDPLNVNTLNERTGINIQELSVALTMLELSGAAVRVTGDRYIKNSQTACIPKTDDMRIFANKDNIAKSDQLLIDGVLAFIRSHFQGISRKYLQNYLVAYRNHTAKDKRRTDQILKSCLRYGQLTTMEIVNFISPLIVSL